MSKIRVWRRRSERAWADGVLLFHRALRSRPGLHFGTGRCGDGGRRERLERVLGEGIQHDVGIPYYPFFRLLSAID